MDKERLKIEFGYVPTYGLWKQAMIKGWDICEQKYESILETKQLLRVRLDGDIIAYASYAIFADELSLYLLVVMPNYRRQGVAQLLLSTLEEQAKSHGVRQLTLCSHQSQPLWRALPDSLNDAVAFFEANGWRNHKDSLDQYRNIEHYQTPTFLLRKHEPEAMSVALMSEEQKSAVLAFIAHYFPHWYPFYEQLVLEDKFENVLVVTLHNKVVASCLLHYPGEYFCGANWLNILGEHCAAPAVLGVANEHRGKNIAYYLFDEAIKHLKKRGAKSVFINQSDAAAIYAKYGFNTIWRYGDYAKLI